MNPLPNNSCNYLDSSCILDSVNPYGERATGADLGTKSMLSSSCLDGSNPGKSFGKTSGYSRPIGMSSSFNSSSLVFIAFTKKVGYPFGKYLQVFMTFTIFKVRKANYLFMTYHFYMIL